MNEPPPSAKLQRQPPAVDQARPDSAQLSMRSAVDPWLVAVLVGSVLGVLYLAGQTVTKAPLQAVVAMVMAFVACSVVLMRGVPCFYVLTEDALLIRGGIEKRRIPYTDIHSVEPIWSPIGATAWSARRLRIKHSHGSEQISPLHRDQFEQALLQRLR